jgi:hypothetical protein
MGRRLRLGSGSVAVEQGQSGAGSGQRKVSTWEEKDNDGGEKKRRRRLDPKSGIPNKQEPRLSLRR